MNIKQDNPKNAKRNIIIAMIGLVSVLFVVLLLLCLYQYFSVSEVFLGKK